jgi:hypothetical protein
MGEGRMARFNLLNHPQAAERGRLACPTVDRNTEEARLSLGAETATRETGMEGDGVGPLVLGETVSRRVAIRSNTTEMSSMLSDDEVLTLARSLLRSILRCGAAWGLDAEAQMISSELQMAANSGGSKSQRAYEVCRKAFGVIFARKWNWETFLHREFETPDSEIDS